MQEMDLGSEAKIIFMLHGFVYVFGYPENPKDRNNQLQAG